LTPRPAAAMLLAAAHRGSGETWPVEVSHPGAVGHSPDQEPPLKWNGPYKRAKNQDFFLVFSLISTCITA